MIINSLKYNIAELFLHIWSNRGRSVKIAQDRFCAETPQPPGSVTKEKEIHRSDNNKSGGERAGEQMNKRRGPYFRSQTKNKQLFLKSLFILS